LDAQAQPIDDTVRQEHYVEDRFDVSISTQRKLARALSEAGTNRFRMPPELARLLMAHAFLGQLDVNPLRASAKAKTHLRQGEFWAEKVGSDGSAPIRIRIEGTSEVAGAENAGRRGKRSDGRNWAHEVQLTWDGLIDMQGDRITRLLIEARGSGKLPWGNVSFKGPSGVA